MKKRICALLLAAVLVYMPYALAAAILTPLNHPTAQGTAWAAYEQEAAAQVVLLRQQMLQRLHRRVRHRLAADGLHLDGAGLPVQYAAGHIGVVQQQTQLARRLKALK